jgi:hypothetical protein
MLKPSGNGWGELAPSQTLMSALSSIIVKPPHTSSLPPPLFHHPRHLQEALSVAGLDPAGPLSAVLDVPALAVGSCLIPLVFGPLMFALHDASGVLNPRTPT